MRAAGQQLLEEQGVALRPGEQRRPVRDLPARGRDARRACGPRPPRAGEGRCAGRRGCGRAPPEQIAVDGVGVSSSVRNVSITSRGPVTVRAKDSKRSWVDRCTQCRSSTARRTGPQATSAIRSRRSARALAGCHCDRWDGSSMAATRRATGRDSSWPCRARSNRTASKTGPNGYSCLDVEAVPGQNLEVGCRRHRCARLDQAGLPHSGVAPHQHRCRHTRGHPPHRLIQQGELGTPADQLGTKRRVGHGITAEVSGSNPPPRGYDLTRTPPGGSGSQRLTFERRDQGGLPPVCPRVLPPLPTGRPPRPRCPRYHQPRWLPLRV